MTKQARKTFGLSLQEAAAFLCITEQQMRGLAVRGSVPFKKSKQTGEARFRRCALVAWRRATRRKKRPRFVKSQAVCPECRAINVICRDQWRRGPQPWPRCSGCGAPIPDVN